MTVVYPPNQTENTNQMRSLVAECCNVTDDSSIDHSSDYDSDDSSAFSDSSLGSSFDDMSESPQKKIGGKTFLSLDMVQMLCESSSERNLFTRTNSCRNLLERTNSFHAKKEAPISRGMVYAIQTESATDAPTGVILESGDYENPKEQLGAILDAHGVSKESRPSSALTFVVGNTDTYGLELMTAVRQGNLSTIRKLHAQGTDLQCCNRFGESIVHAAARRGNTEILKFLVEEAGISLRVCCDGGRTPLHDAAWSASPSFGCISYLLQHNSEYLLVADKRNFTPLDYCPKSSYAAWDNFLEQHKEQVLPNW